MLTWPYRPGEAGCGGGRLSAYVAWGGGVGRGGRTPDPAHGLGWGRPDKWYAPYWGSRNLERGLSTRGELDGRDGPIPWVRAWAVYLANGVPDWPGQRSWPCGPGDGTCVMRGGFYAQKTHGM